MKFASKRTVIERLLLGVLAGAVAFVVAYSARPRGRAPDERRLTMLETREATFELDPQAAQLIVRSRDGSLARRVDLLLVVDREPRPLVFERSALTRITDDSLNAQTSARLDDTLVRLDVRLDADRARSALRLALAGDAMRRSGHTVTLQAELESEGQVVFVSGVGQLADRANVQGALLVDEQPHPLGIVSSGGPVSVEALPEDAVMNIQPLHLTITSPTVSGATTDSSPTSASPTASSATTDSSPTSARPTAVASSRADLWFVVGDSSGGIWRSFAQLKGEATASVRGRVGGAAPGALVFGRDSQGHPQVRSHAGEGGTFAVDVPVSVTEWYSAVDAGTASKVVPFVPGTPNELVLDVSPGGDLHVKIQDGDAKTPLTARLLVHGVEGTLDPSFGPDYRASGAGPVIDALRGDVTTPLPSGRYRVAATKGIEWSIDARVVDIAPGRVTSVELEPRHVVPTPGVVSCDLHVHARPSFDTPVAPEDRVLSLAAAGVDFAVPTEHNVVGDYTSALETLDLGRELLTVPGVEVTTSTRSFGHFGVFPYSRGTPVPPFRHTNMSAIFHAVRTDAPAAYFQLNHPRLPREIGYFNKISFDPKAPRSQIRGRIDFDGIEVFNGYDTERPDRVDQVLRDYWALLDFGWRYTATGSSDSHRIQFHWAGYPRTMVTFDPGATTDSEGLPSDPMLIVANVKLGHAVVTSGPIIELQLGGVRPGDEVVTADDPLRGHLRVRAAPWVDVTAIDEVTGEIGGAWKIVGSLPVTSRPTEIGPESGTLEEAQARTIRFDADIEIPVGPGNGWVQIIVRGERRMDDVLPFMPVAPLAFTNPVYVVREPAAPPPFPWVPAGGP